MKLAVSRPAPAAARILSRQTCGAYSVSSSNGTAILNG
jgi:hypothetical protein